VLISDFHERRSAKRPTGSRRNRLRAARHFVCDVTQQADVDALRDASLPPSAMSMC
jgi:hypothetical protein